MKKTETKSTVLLQHHLKVLKLPTVQRECEKVASRCATENVDHLAFLLQLCELELIDRERRAAERRLKAAKFPMHKTLETFDFKAQPSLNKVLITELMLGEYIDTVCEMQRLARQNAQARAATRRNKSTQTSPDRPQATKSVPATTTAPRFSTARRNVV